MSIELQDLDKISAEESSIVAPGAPESWDRIFVDSRKIVFGRRGVFFALKGLRNDGHRFIMDAYKRGVRAFVVSQEVEEVHLAEAHVFRVSDTLEALQLLTRHHRHKFDIPVVGITGSNAKTIVKEWLVQLLQVHHKVCSSPGSFNSQIGVPLSLIHLTEEHDIGVFEAGISQEGEMVRLQQMIDPDYGIMTNIGDAHSQGFPSISHKLEEKLRLFGSCRSWVYCRDHTLIQEAVSEGSVSGALSWSLNSDDADIRISLQASDLEIQYLDQRHSFKCPFSERHDIENLCHVLALLMVLGKLDAITQESISALTPPQWRLEITTGPGQSTIVNDSYNHDKNGLEQALASIQNIGGDRQKIIVLSAMEQQREEDRQLALQTNALLRDSGIDLLLTIGMDATIHELVSAELPEAKRFNHREEIGRYLHSVLGPNDIVLIKGARNYRLDLLSQSLAAHMHRTFLHINLSAISRNLGVLTSGLQSDTRLMAMVKADAYGAGAPLVEHLQRERVDYLGVAFVNEGVRLRQQGIHLPIMVMNVEPHQASQVARHRLEIQINTIDQLRAMLVQSRELGFKIPVHLNFETGMNRMGITSEEIPDFLELLREEGSRMEIRGLMTHLAASEDPEQDAFTETQIERFLGFRQMVQQTVDCSRALAHVLNSAGVLRHERHQMDMVRVGIAMYGLQGMEHAELIASHSMYSKILRIHEVRAGESVGYSRSFIAPRQMRIATVSCGYADGIPRILGHSGFKFCVREEEAPIVGHICMDFCMIDVSDIPEVQIEDEVRIFGDRNSLRELSSQAKTIPYEIISSIAPRVQRVYGYENH